MSENYADLYGAFENRDVMITGGAGFIGSHLVQALVEAGSRITVVDRNIEGVDGNLASFKSKIYFVHATVDGAFSLENSKLIAPNYIFHLANESSIHPSSKNPFNDLTNNVCSTLSILEMMRYNWPSSVLVYLSSAAVYGEPQSLPISEEHPLHPISPYGVSKLSAEHYLTLYSEIFELKTAVLRPFSVYGPRQRKLAVYDLITKLMNNPRTLEIIGDGSETRDFIYVRDLIQAMLTVAVHGELKGECYNAASGVRTSVHRLVTKMAEIMNLTPELEFTGRLRMGDPKHWKADISKLVGLGFKTNYSLDSGLIDVINWLSET